MAIDTQFFVFVSVSACRSRWSNIRDNFRKSLNKQKTKSGQKLTKIKPYKYSEQLNFLKKFFDERETMSNIQNEVVNETSTGEKESEEDLSDEKDLSTEENTQDLVKLKPAGTGSRKNPKRSAPNQTSQKSAAATVMEYILEKNKAANCPPPTQHPVDAFLGGIAPALKKLSCQEWHYAKGELFAIVQKYEYNMLNPSLNQSMDESTEIENNNLTNFLF